MDRIVREHHDAELLDALGLVDWTRSLVGSDNERLMTSGLSLERRALLALSDSTA